MSRPLFPPSVLIIDSDATFNEAAADITTGVLTKIDGHFSNERWALLFKASTTPYTVSVNVGYYVQVLGLGSDPTGVVFNGADGVYCANFGGSDGGMLNTFWRSAENFTMQQKLVWGVSQAAPLRSIICNGGLSLYADPYYVQVLPPEFSKDDKGRTVGTYQTQVTYADYDKTSGYGACNNSSGGFAANIQVNGGTLNQGSQQQFCFRNVSAPAGCEGGAWSMMYIGCDAPINGVGSVTAAKSNNFQNYSPPAFELDGDSVTAGFNTDTGNAFWGQFVSVADTPVIAEKPFISCDAGDAYALNIPPILSSAVGPKFAVAGQTSKLLSGSEVYVTWPVGYSDYDSSTPVVVGKDTADTMQKALDLGKDLIITPGIYYLDHPLRVKHSNQVILSIGMATLIAPPSGEPCIQVLKGLTGVRLAGLFLEANVVTQFAGSKLLHWGCDRVSEDPELDKSKVPSKENPSGFIYDLFCRVGGSNPDPRVGVETIVQIDSDWVIGDNLWLWRADHSSIKPVNFPTVSKNFYQTVWGEYPCDTGLRVTGNNVSIYGLAVEHTNKDNVQWTGNNGKVYFFQNELPYDAKSDFASQGYAAYRVDGLKTPNFTHTAYATGVYSNFRDHEVVVPTGIVVDGENDSSINFINSFTVYLPSAAPFMGGGNSSIEHVINQLGTAANRPATNRPQWMGHVWSLKQT